MIESLIYLKWKCLLPVFYVILATYATFLGALNTFLVATFYGIDSNNGSFCNETTTDTSCVRGCGYHFWILRAMIYISIILLFAQELSKIYLQRLRYFMHVESCVSLCGLVLAALVPVLVECSPEPAPAPWQRHVACAALLLAWTQGMLLLARCPGWGYYLLMFERVAINIFKILVTSICLVLGFAISFMIYYKSKPPFDGLIAAFVKTLVMMASEFDYEDLFGAQHDAELDATKTVVRILFTMFVIFVAIVLMNFMIGVAVSDINQLTNIGNIRRLELQMEMLSTLEGLGHTLGKWSTKLLRTIRYHSVITGEITSPDKEWTIYYLDERRHNSFFLLRLPSKLQNRIYDIARKKKDDVNTLDALYEAVVGRPRNPKLNSNVGGGSNSAVALTDRIKSIEDSIKEIKQSNDDLKNDIRVVLEILSNVDSHLATDRSEAVYRN